MTPHPKQPQQNSSQELDYQALAEQIKQWGKEIGFDAVGITDVELSKHEAYLNSWIDEGMHGTMGYMHKHGSKRSHPEQLIEGTKRVISVRMDYAPADMKQAESVLEQQEVGYISRYALGRDYHKVMRKKLKTLTQKISSHIGEFGHRVFTDSAPVLEKALAEKAGLGWIGKHTNLIEEKTGSWFFLGEIYVDIPLPIDTPSTNHCGSCSSCIDICPTQAIVAPYKVDARLCISYLTIELKEAIPENLRSKMGNRIYGCDDCQLTCPWNKFAQMTREPDFTPRSELTDKKLTELFKWDESTFLKNTEGTAIRRIGFESWQRNIAVAIGNIDSNAEQAVSLITLLQSKQSVSDMVREHIEWAIKQQTKFM